MRFDECNERMTPLANVLSVTTQKRGVIPRDNAAHSLAGNADTSLRYDRHVMALRAMTTPTRTPTRSTAD